MREGRTRVQVTAVYKNGEVLHSEEKFRAKTVLRAIEMASVFSEVTIRMIVPSNKAEELFEAISNAEVVDLNIEGAKTPLEREVDEKGS